MGRWVRFTLGVLLSVVGLLALWYGWRRRCQLEEELISRTELGTITRIRLARRPAPPAPPAPSTVEGPVPPAPGQAQVSAAEGPAPSTVEGPVPSAAEGPATDDLTRIKGIGPKISRALQAAGITTFAQLAAADLDELKRIIAAGGARLADPGAWPEQARLAAAGEWEQLGRLQSGLKGGRRG